MCTLYYGWKHFWCDYNLDNLVIKEYIKGPFRKPKFVYPFPFVTSCQQDPNGSPLNVCGGIPDPWADCLISNFNLTKKLLQNHESMHKEDVDIVRSERRNHPLYLGQGIPDPWIYYNRINSEFFDRGDLKADIKKYVYQLLHDKNCNENFRNQHCLCCEKRFLFDCPDKKKPSIRNVLNCSCQDCHGKRTDCGENCRCIQILQNWVKNNTNLIKEKDGEKTNRKEPPPLNSPQSSKLGSIIHGETTAENFNAPLFCTCPRTLEIPNTTTFSNANPDPNHSQYVSRKEYIPESKTKRESYDSTKDAGGNIGFCPCLRKWCCKHKTSGKKNLPRFNEIRPCFCRNIIAETRRPSPIYSNKASKKVQTEKQPAITKVIQTENKIPLSLEKIHCERQCNSKYFTCNFCLCNTSYPSLFCNAGQQVPNVFCPFIPSPPFCPYTYQNGLFFHHHKPCCLKCRRAKENFKESETQVEPKAKQKGTNNSWKTNENFENYKPSTTPINYFKHLPDVKVKEHFQRREFPVKTQNSKYVYNCRSKNCNWKIGSTHETEKLYERTPTKIISDRSKLGSQDKNKYVDIYRLESKDSYMPLFNSVSQTTVILTNKTVGPKEKIPTKVTFFKEKFDSDESRTYGLISHCKNPRKFAGKRKKSVSNRMKGKKWTTDRKTVVSKHFPLPNNITNSSEIFNKFVPSEESTLQRIKFYPHCKGTCFNFMKNGQKNSYLNKTINFKRYFDIQKYLATNNEFTDVSKAIEQESVGKEDKFPFNYKFATRVQPPLSVLQFNEEQEKITQNTVTDRSHHSLQNDTKCLPKIVQIEAHNRYFTTYEQTWSI